MDAQVVLSTFWRHFEGYIAYILQRQGIDATRVVGKTPGRPNPEVAAILRHSVADERGGGGGSKKRADEISAWLAAHPSVKRFVILDDRATASNVRLAAHFVKTDPRYGLTDDDVQRAREILSLESADCSGKPLAAK